MGEEEERVKHEWKSTVQQHQYVFTESIPNIQVTLLGVQHTYTYTYTYGR